MTYGGRFVDRYQFPSTSSAALERGAPLQTVGPIGPKRAIIEVVPLLHGRTAQWDVCSRWPADPRPGEDVGSTMCIVHSEDEVRRELLRLVEEYGR